MDDPEELEHFIKENNFTGIEIELKDLKNILSNVVLEDAVKYTLAETDAGFETAIIEIVSDRLIQKINDFNQKGNLQSIKNGKAFHPINISDNGLELIELIALDCENLTGPWHSTTEIKIDKLGYVTKDGVKTKTFWNGTINSVLKPKRLKVRNISGDETVLTVT